MMGVFLFSVALSVFYFSTLNDTNSSDESLESISYAGREITNAILSEGFPASWDSSSLIQIGVLSENKINETKLEAFYLLTQSDYIRTKGLFATSYDYYFFLDSNISFNSTTIDGIGKPGVTRDSIVSDSSVKNLVKINRVTIYKDRPTGAVLYVWE